MAGVRRKKRSHLEKAGSGGASTVVWLCGAVLGFGGQLRVRTWSQTDLVCIVALPPTSFVASDKLPCLGEGDSGTGLPGLWGDYLGSGRCALGTLRGAQ